MCLCSLSPLVNGFTLHQTGCLGLGLNGRRPVRCQHASSVTRTLLNLMAAASSVVKHIMCYMHSDPLLTLTPWMQFKHTKAEMSPGITNQLSDFLCWSLTSCYICSRKPQLALSRSLKRNEANQFTVQQWVKKNVLVSVGGNAVFIWIWITWKRYQWEKVIIAGVCNGRWVRVDVAVVKISPWYILCESSASSLLHYHSLS